MRGFLDKLKKAVAREEKTPEMVGADATAENEAAWDEQVRREFMEFHDTTPLPEGPTVSLHDGPVRLRPVMPLPGQEVSGSWIGGLPSLPPEMPWPVLGDNPALFLAQIDCSELPVDLWGGAGPREGWLVFFVAQDRLSELCVRHVDGTLEERRPPEGLNYPHGMNWPAALSRDIWPDFGVTPRWPVIVEEIAELPAESGIERKLNSKNLPRQECYRDFGMSAGRYPFDWASALLLLHSAAEDLERWAGVYRDRVAKGEEDAAELMQSSEAAARSVARLIEGVEGARARASFSDEAAELVVEGLRRVKRKVEIWDEDGRKVVASPVIGSSTVMRQYLPLAEMRARQIYCADPAALPEAQKAYFERLWLSDAEFESGYMGGCPEGSFFEGHVEAGAVPLLMLPTSDLIGWMWGDLGDLGIFIRGSDLEPGHWDNAWAADTQG
ncbi:DUF1963 domain-containing protein [Lutimaribacter saemankumensis]|uniref:DUF1963 domain-containing protein n=1 Tax=Lutimaribacter saemankumensis TaxID=490829 RepID=A0A1G8Q6A7_9RHOB|nr:DUF1963 domain-containing protein [Lutimaribacter saemankumensis]SDJ00267.1 protein of unknown function [Lutimaribacter saemankumensis]